LHDTATTPSYTLSLHDALPISVIDGIDVVRFPEAVRAIIGYMPDFFGVYDDIKVWEYLDFFAAAYKIPRVKRPGIIDDEEVRHVDRKSTRLNSSHVAISYAVFC